MRRRKPARDGAELQRGNMTRRMNITPTPAFMEAVRQVLGIDNLIPSPVAVIRSSLCNEFRTVHADICESGAGRAADMHADEVWHRLEVDGINDKAAAKKVAAEWKRVYDELSNRNVYRVARRGRRA
jgi:hypothetical protein